MSSYPLLLVEDNEDDAFLMIRAIKGAGIDADCLHVARDGKEALDYIFGRGNFVDRKQFPAPSLVLLDLKLPQVSGFEVLSAVREQGESRAVIMVVLTSSNHPSDIRKSYQLGANSYVVKPGSFEKLAEFARTLKEYWILWNRAPVTPDPA